MSLTSKTIVEKQPGETLNLSMDFSDYVSSSSITLSSPSAAVSPSDLTISSPSVSSQTVTFTVSGGTSGQTYRIEITVNTSDSEVLIGEGILKVRGR
jgi:hypothetical protein